MLAGVIPLESIASSSSSTKEENRETTELAAEGCAHAGGPLALSIPGRGVLVGVVSTLTEGVVRVRAPGQSVHLHIPRQKLEQGPSKAAIVVLFFLSL